MAPKLISEMRCICEVSLVGINLTREMAGSSTALMECLEEVASPGRNQKIGKVRMVNLSTDSIFEAETFCKKFVNKLRNVRTYEIK